MMGTVKGTSAMQSVGLSALKHSAAFSDRIRKPPRGIVVLLYHRVGRRSSVRVDLPEWLFEEQIERIAVTPGVMDIDSALSALGGEAPSGPDPVVVTFDDGTADFVEVALPVLARYKVPATLYVATDFVESGRSFPDAGTPASWQALNDAVSTGLITIGSHTHSHALLDRLPTHLIAEELERSVSLIAERLGVAARHFAYPKAVPGSPQAETAVRERFASAALAGTRANAYSVTDPYRLARSPVQVDDGLGFFALKVAGGMRLEDDVRRLANGRRFDGATN
jgi:peptidoglycan/xylan/chitin deacetylase (PgdA/CDA1 family)